MKRRAWIEYRLYVEKLLEPTRKTDERRADNLAAYTNAVVRTRLGLPSVTAIAPPRDVWNAQHAALETLKLMGVVDKKKMLSNVGDVMRVTKQYPV